MATALEDCGDHPPLVGRGLPLAVKRRIVELFAQFHGLSSVRDIISKEFNLDLDDRTFATYDPSRSICRMGKRLRILYDETRKAYVERSADVAIAHQAHRLRLLSRVVEKAEKAKDFSSALKGLELAAKEMGGVLTNTHKVEHQGTVEHRHLSIEDARGELATRLAALVEGGTLTPLPAPAEGATEEPKE